MITKIKKIKPMFNGLITTMERYGQEYLKGTTMIDPTKTGTVKEYQKVVAVGPHVKGIEVGDTVFINPKRYAVMEHKEGGLQDGVIKDNPVVGYKFEIVEIEVLNSLIFLTSFSLNLHKVCNPFLVLSW